MPTLYEWFDIWIDLGRERLKAKTIKSYLSVRKIYIPPAIGNLPLNRVRAIAIEQHFAALAKSRPKGLHAPDRYSDATIHIAYRVLRAAINAAHRKGVISHNPMTQVTAPKAPKGRQNAFSVDEVRSVLNASKGDPLEPLWWISLVHGLRQGETLALQWNDIDFAAGTMLVQRQVQRVSGGWVFDETKNKEQRTLPLEDRLIASLRRHRVRQAEQRLAAGDRWEDFDLVFTSSKGTPIDSRNDRRNWNALLDRAGVRRVRRHDARHTAASMIYQITKDPVQVQKTLGHSQVAFTMATYVHHSPEELRHGNDAVAAVLFA
jgi:integrase